MEFLYLLEGIRTEFGNTLMLAVTVLGEELPFLILALIVFWCVDKDRGYYVMSVGLLGTLTSQFMKILCRIPRPWVRDPNFTIVEQAREAAGGYSFPSGHTQSAVGTFGSIAASAKHRLVQSVCIAAFILVGFSRMYLGVHTPEDVLVGALISGVLIFALRPLIVGKHKRFAPLTFLVMLVLSIVYVIYVETNNFPAGLDASNYASALKNAYTVAGTLCALPLVYWFDEKKLHFPVKAVWWAQILKVALGLLLALAVKEGLRAPLEALCGGHLISRGIRYFLLVLTAGILWPMSFKFFAKLGKK